MPERRRFFEVVRLMTGVCVFYFTVNHFHVRRPVLLPLTALDRAVPFCWWALPIYFSHFLFLPLALLSLRREAPFVRAVKAFIIATAVSCAVFVVWPTTYPRPEFPGWMSALVRLLDTPANCFPSLHVSLAAIAAWSLFEDGRPWARLGAAWTLLIVVSTVLVKQHYAADAVSGLAVAALSVRLSARPAPETVPAGEPA